MKFKKILLSMGTASLVVAPILTVIACGTEKGIPKPTDADMQIALNTSLTNGSFNFPLKEGNYKYKDKDGKEIDAKMSSGSTDIDQGLAFTFPDGQSSQISTTFTTKKEKNAITYSEKEIKFSFSSTGISEMGINLFDFTISFAIDKGVVSANNYKYLAETDNPTASTLPTEVTKFFAKQFAGSPEIVEYINHSIKYAPELYLLSTRNAESILDENKKVLIYKDKNGKDVKLNLDVNAFYSRSENGLDYDYVPSEKEKDNPIVFKIFNIISDLQNNSFSLAYTVEFNDHKFMFLIEFSVKDLKVTFSKVTIDKKWNENDGKDTMKEVLTTYFGETMGKNTQTVNFINETLSFLNTKIIPWK